MTQLKNILFGVEENIETLEKLKKVLKSQIFDFVMSQNKKFDMKLANGVLIYQLVKDKELVLLELYIEIQN